MKRCGTTGNASKKGKKEENWMIEACDLTALQSRWASRTTPGKLGGRIELSTNDASPAHLGKSNPSPTPQHPSSCKLLHQAGWLRTCETSGTLGQAENLPAVASARTPHHITATTATTSKNPTASSQSVQSPIRTRTPPAI
jgi:hypothetical protein